MLGTLLFTAAVYVVILWLDEYKAFLHTNVPVAINGRYLLPILPPIILTLGLGFRALLPRFRILASGLLASLAISFLLGGGLLTYVIRSNDAWYWPSPAVRSVNHAVQRVLDPVIPGSNKPTKYLH